jgi:hypothetical protein
MIASSGTENLVAANLRTTCAIPNTETRLIVTNLTRSGTRSTSGSHNSNDKNIKVEKDDLGCSDDETDDETDDDSDTDNESRVDKQSTEDHGASAWFSSFVEDVLLYTTCLTQLGNALECPVPQVHHNADIQVITIEPNQTSTGTGLMTDVTRAETSSSVAVSNGDEEHRLSKVKLIQGYNKEIIASLMYKSLRPVSLWSAQDDKILLRARSQGLNWNQIAPRHFPKKSPHSCRHLHERLTERVKAKHWDNDKLDVLSREYMGIRREMWYQLASRVGETWQSVESKVSSIDCVCDILTSVQCMEMGFKNLSQTARSAMKETGYHLDASGARLNTNGVPSSILSPPPSLPEISSEKQQHDFIDYQRNKNQFDPDMFRNRPLPGKQSSSTAAEVHVRTTNIANGAKAGSTAHALTACCRCQNVSHIVQGILILQNLSLTIVCHSVIHNVIQGSLAADPANVPILTASTKILFGARDCHGTTFCICSRIPRRIQRNPTEPKLTLKPRRSSGKDPTRRRTASEDTTGKNNELSARTVSDLHLVP